MLMAATILARFKGLINSMTKTRQDKTTNFKSASFFSHKKSFWHIFEYFLATVHLLYWLFFNLFFEAKKENLVKSIQHKKFLDSRLIKDNEFKYSLSPVFQINLTKRATRDMLIFFTRKPCLDKHISFPYDSTKPHPDYPVDFRLE